MERRKFIKYSLCAAGISFAGSYPTCIERNIITITKNIMEIANQWTARREYHKLLSALGIKPAHLEYVKKI